MKPANYTGIPRSVVNNAAANLPPEARRLYEAERARLDRGAINSGAEAGANVLDAAAATVDDLVRVVDQNESVIARIQADAQREGRGLSERDQRRIEGCQESIAVASSELRARPGPGRQSGDDQALPVRGGGPAASLGGARLSRGGHDRQQQPDARHGILLPQNCASPSSLLMGARTPDAWGQDSAEFFHLLANGMSDPRFMRNAIGTEGTGNDGGFAVPMHWFNGVIDQALQASEYAARCRLFMADSNALSIPMPDFGGDHSTDLGGLVGHWAAEAQAQQAQALRWRSVELKLNKIFIPAAASSELLEDAPSYAATLQTGMSAATTLSLDSSIHSGNGVGKPLGIVGSASAISIAPESGQTADTVTFTNLADVFCRLTPACQKRATWFISGSVLPQLLRMVFPGTELPVLLGGAGAGANNAATSAPIGFIFGRPVVVSEVQPQAGDVGDVVLADLSQYALLLKKTARFEASNGLGFLSDVHHWRMIWRVTGTALWAQPVTPFAGGPTQSWAAYLAARA